MDGWMDTPIVSGGCGLWLYLPLRVVHHMTYLVGYTFVSISTLGLFRVKLGVARVC